MKNKFLNNVFFYTYFIIFLLNIISINFSQNISSYYIVIEILVLSILLLINYDEIKKDTKNIVLMFFSILFSILSIVFSSGGIGSLINSICFFEGLILFDNIKIEKNKKNFIYLTCFILYIFFCIMSKNIWISYIKKTNLFNPNTVGTFIFFSFAILNNSFPRKKYKIIKLVMYAITMYCIYLTECRSALLGCFIYTLLCIISPIGKTIVKYKKIILYIIVIFGTLFTIIYVNLYRNNFNIQIPFFQKTIFTGREKLWDNMLKSMDDNKIYYIFGAGTNNKTSIGIINNMHNWYLGVLYTFGIPIYIIYFIMMTNKIIKCNNKIVLYAFIGIYIIGYVETVGLWSNSRTFIFILFLLKNSNEKVKEIKSNDINIYTSI